MYMVDFSCMNFFPRMVDHYKKITFLINICCVIILVQSDVKTV